MAKARVPKIVKPTAPKWPTPEVITLIGYRICRFANGRDACRCSERGENVICHATAEVASHIATIAQPPH